MSSASALGVMQLLATQSGAFMAALLIASSAHKLIRRAHTQAVVQQFAGVPQGLSAYAVAAVSLVEMLAGVLLIVPAQRATGAVLAALIWGSYLGLILRAIAQGRRNVDCGCSFGAAQRPLGVYQVARNAVLLGLATAVGLESAANVSAAVPAAQLLGALTFLALYLAIDQAMALQPMRSGEAL
jgi:hypothetical protein